MTEAANVNPSPTVLVVDDDDFFHVVMGELLAVLGVNQVLQAKNGRAGLKMLKTHTGPIDFLLCDVFMPDMDGIEFLNNLASMKYQGGIMVASGVDMEILDLARTIAKANGLNLTGAFSKPIALGQLAEAMGLTVPEGGAG
jgi:CheY-like chemotaxis protein